MPALLAASIHAELAFERWRRGDRVLAYGSLSRAAELLLNVREPDDNWKVAITLFGNFAGFYAYVTRGKSEDSWPYARPSPGCIFDRNSSVLDLFDPAKLYVIAAQLTLLAEGLGLHDEALRWAGRANLADFDLGMHSMMIPYRVAAHVAGGRFSDALGESWGAYAGGTAALSADQRAVQFSLHTGKVTAVTICFSLASVRVRRGTAEAEHVSVLLEDQLRRLAASDPDPFWAAVVDAIHQIATGGRNWRTLYETGLEWEKSEATQLGIMYRLAAMMNAAPREAFHLTVCSFQKQAIPWLGDTPYDVVVIPFLRSYWRWAFEQYSFNFSAPPRTARELDDALSVPGEAGLRNALKVVSRSLGIALTDKYREYLSNGDC